MQLRQWSGLGTNYKTTNARVFEQFAGFIESYFCRVFVQQIGIRALVL